jgi:hypothetical protein
VSIVISAPICNKQSYKTCIDTQAGLPSRGADAFFVFRGKGIAKTIEVLYNEVTLKNKETSTL